MIDTSAWIEFLRATGSPSHLEVRSLLDQGEAAWCDMVQLELRNGGDAPQARTLERITPLVWMFAIDDRIWDAAKKLAVRARAAGVTAPAADVLISACARSFDLKVLHHGDTHFHDLATIDLS